MGRDKHTHKPLAVWGISLLVLLLFSSFGISGIQIGPSAQPVAAQDDFDLCNLLRTVTAGHPGVILVSPANGPGSEPGCQVVGKEDVAEFSTITIYKAQRADAARDNVYGLWQQSSGVGGHPAWVPTSYGDYGFEIPVSPGASTWLLVAQGCYVVQGNAGFKSSPTGSVPNPLGPVRDLVIQILSKLKSFPCGTSNLATATPVKVQVPSNALRIITPMGDKACSQGAERVASLRIMAVPGGVDTNLIPVLFQQGDDPSKTTSGTLKLKEAYPLNKGQTVQLSQTSGWKISIAPPLGAGKRQEISGPGATYTLFCDPQPTGLLGTLTSGVAQVYRDSGASEFQEAIKNGVKVEDIDFGINVVGPALDQKPKLAAANQYERLNAAPQRVNRAHLDTILNLDSSATQEESYDIVYAVDALNPSAINVTSYLGRVVVTPKNTAQKPITLEERQQVEVTGGGISSPKIVVEVPGNESYTFPETGKSALGLFLDYWRNNGGLTQQGYPISDLMREKSDLNGQTYTVQYFERAVFEFHPEYPPPNDVLLSQLGTFQYKRKYPNGAPGQKANTSPGSRLFIETNHRIGGKFLDYWNTHGGLAQQGLPLSEEFTEVSETDGKPYLVQYFERAVFEYHPEYAPPNDVLLSLLGNFFYKQKYGGGGPGPVTTATPFATATPVAGGGQCSGIPANQNMTVSPSNCDRAGSTFDFDGYGFNSGESIHVYATSPSGQIIEAQGTIVADQNGTVSGQNSVTFITTTTSATGVWSLTMEGITSHMKAIGYIKLLAP